MCEEADGYNDVESRDIARARTRHVCSGCRRDISPGQLYIKTKVLYDGNWSSWKHCGRCNRLMTELVDRHDDWVAVDPEFCCGMSWLDAFDEDPPEGVQALAFVDASEASEMLEEAYLKQCAVRAEARARRKAAQV